MNPEQHASSNRATDLPGVRKAVQRFLPTYVLTFVGLSFFFFIPARGMNDWSTLWTTVYQMLLLAAIVTPYALAVVFLDGEATTSADG